MIFSKDIIVKNWSKREIADLTISIKDDMIWKIWLINVNSFKFVTSNVILMITSMLEFINDEWFY
jgi:hypothetical protein